jgi:VWFA-related protein
MGAARVNFSRLFVFLLVALSILAAVSLPAQDSVNQGSLSQTQKEQEPLVRAQSNVVLVPVLVKDSHGKIIYGLHAEDFILTDDGAEQTLHLDEDAEEQPISVIVAVQTGRRAEYELPRMAGLASMLDPILSQPGSQAAVVTFDSGTTLAQDFTGNSDKIEAILRQLQPGDNGAAILDTAHYCANLLGQQPANRTRVLLLVSETRDHGSHYTSFEDLIREIGDSNIAVYALAFSPSLSNILDTGRGSNKEEMSPGPDLLAPLRMAVASMKKNVPRGIAEMTGGEYELFESRKKFETRVNDFDNHLHSRYLLSFQPKDPKTGLHEIHVRLRSGNATVLARSNYWANGSTQ